MKIATTGKGGSGKTTIAGTLARILAEDGQRVLAIDGDPNPNLAAMLGIERERSHALPNIPASVMQVVEAPDGSRALRPAMDEAELLERYGIEAPASIRLIIMGRPPDGSAGSGCMCASHRAVRGLIAHLSACGEYTVTDMEAGLEHLKRGTARNVDMMLIIAEPYYRSLEAAARTFRLARELGIPEIAVVANKVGDASDRRAIEDFCQHNRMDLLAVVPDERQFIEAERHGRAPIDYDPDCAGIQAIRAIAEQLLSTSTNFANEPVTEPG